MSRRPKTPRSTLTIALLIVLVIGCIPLLFALRFGEWQSHARELETRFHALGWAAPLVFVLATTLLIALGAPRLLFCALGGMLFGFMWGFVLSQLGSMFGEYGTFLFARWATRAYLLNAL